MEIDKILEQAGLDQKESKVYLALLRLGESTIVPITKQTNLPRTTVFHILERLREQKVIEIMQHKSRRVYIPYNPRKISMLLKNKRQELDKQIDSFEDVLPDLFRMYASSPFQPKVRFFRGEEIKQIYEEILDIDKKEIYYTGNINQLDEILGKKYLAAWIKRKVAKGIWTKSIRSHTTESELEIYKPGKHHLRKARYASNNYKSPAHIFIYEDNVAILTSSKENFGVVITSHDFAVSMKNMFGELWRQL